VRSGYADGVVWPAPRPDAARVLVCFGFCGGGTTAYRPWVRTVPPDVDLALVCLPGRERRIAEPPAQRWDQLMDAAVTSVRSVMDRPYLLFGHSMGAWVAYEVALHVQESRAREPEALVVSASSPPSRSAEERRHAPTSRATDDELLDWMCRVGQLPVEIVDDPSLRQLALDLFRADKRAAESYEFRPGRLVRCPVRRLNGTDDPDVDPDDDGWAELAAGPVDARRLPGGHFYTAAVWSELPRYMGL
jgi:surfactin synthase thioesterase subunit